MAMPLYSRMRPKTSLFAQAGQLLGQCLHLVFQRPETLNQLRLPLARLGDHPALLTIGNELRPIQTQSLDVSSASWSQRTQGPVMLLDDVKRDVVVQRMKKSPGGVCGPVIALEFVARMAGIDPVLRRICAALGARLEMVERQFCPDIGFRHPAVSASEPKLAAQRIPLIRTHSTTRRLTNPGSLQAPRRPRPR